MMAYDNDNPAFDSRVAEARAFSAQGYAEQARRDETEAQARRNDRLSDGPVTGSLHIPRPLLSWALLATIPLAATVLFLPPNGKNVQIPVGVHQFLAVMVVSMGSPLLRRFAIALLVLCGVILLAGTLLHLAAAG
jgi:hypothetical protein